MSVDETDQISPSESFSDLSSFRWWISVLLLLLLFLVSSTFLLHPGISVNLPFSKFTLGPQKNPIIVSITAGPYPLIYYRDQQIKAGGSCTSVEEDHSGDRSIIIQADRLTPQGSVIEVMNLCLEKGLFGRPRNFAERKMNQPEARFIFDWRKSRWDYRLPVLIAISFIRAHLLFLYLPRRLSDDHIPSTALSASDRSGSKQPAG